MTELDAIRAGDIDVAYRIEGRAGAPVVMMAHGVLADHSIFDAVTRRLLNDYTVLRYDLRGHGRTEATAGPYTMAQLADDAMALLDALHLHGVHFIGTSLGGMIGQQLGAVGGGRFVSLTLANTAAVQPNPGAWNDRIATAQRDGVQAVVEGTLQRWFTPAFFASRPEEVERIRAVARRTPVEGLIGAAAAVRDLDQLDSLPRIRVPTLVLVGAHDQATPAALGATIHEGIASSRFATLDAAHQAVAEVPEDFCDAWLDFARNS